MVIDPTNFKIAVSLTEAAVRQAQANAQNIERQAQRRQRLSDPGETVEDRQDVPRATRWLRKHNTSRPSPIWTRLASIWKRHKNPLPGQRLGNKPVGAARDYVTVGQNEISLVDGDRLGRRLFRGDQSQLDPRR